MSSNLPPGVTEGMIPGNRPEDQEEEVSFIFTFGETYDLDKLLLDLAADENYKEYLYLIQDIAEQLKEEFPWLQEEGSDG